MGSFGGHALPGSFFVLFGLWWSFKMFFRYFSSRKFGVPFESSVTFNFICLPGRARKWPIEGAIKIILVTVGGAIEIITGFDNTGNFAHIGNGQHATMYLFFGLHGIVDILAYMRVPLPSGLDYLSGCAALIIEYILFKFHLHERKPVDVLVHTLLLYVIICTAVVYIAEMCYWNSILISLTRAFLMLLQGTWFWQIGFILYNPLPKFAKWDLESHRNVTIATLYFSWHVACCIVSMFFIGSLTKIYTTRFYKKRIPEDSSRIIIQPPKTVTYSELTFHDADSDIEIGHSTKLQDAYNVSMKESSMNDVS